MTVRMVIVCGLPTDFLNISLLFVFGYTSLIYYDRYGKSITK
jgi:hypothetical protein